MVVEPIAGQFYQVFDDLRFLLADAVGKITRKM